MVCRFVTCAGGWPTFVPLLVLLVSAGPTLAETATGRDVGPTPVVFLVLEGLPRTSLADPEGGLDATWYPNFAALAATSTEFTAVTTVSARPGDALPAIMTGRLPGAERKLPIVEDHPDNLFSMLGGEYVTNVVETESVLHDDGRGRVAHERRMQALRDDRNEDVSEDAALGRFIGRVRPVARTAAQQRRVSLHFAHIRLPRYPWHLSPRGTSYRPYRMYGIFADVWSDEPWWPEESWRRHLMQLRYVDALLGRLFAALRESGLYDASLIVVVADYGSSFWPGESRRSLGSSAHPEDVLHVPLFVKRPGQKAGAVVDRPGQTIDVLPTVADVLGREPGFDVDGCSLLAASCPPLLERQVLEFDGHGNRRLDALPVDITRRTATLVRRVELIGSGRSPERTFAFGPFAALVGRRLDSLAEPGEQAGVAVPDRQWSRAGLGARGPRVVMAVELEEELATPPATAPPPPPYIAIVREGVIETVVPAPRTRRGRRVVAAMIPERVELAPDAPLELYVVAGSVTAPRLRPLEVRTPKKKARRGG